MGTREWVVGLTLLLGLGCTPSAEEEVEAVDALDTALSEEDYGATVRHLTALPWLPWAYTTDGCYARAAYYSMLLATKGVPTNHVYVVAKRGTSLGGMWSWHVAPLVTKDSESNRLYVLDPVYDTTRALTNLEWVANQGHTDPDVSTYPTLHVHPGNSYLDQYDVVLPLADPAEPVAADYKEPTFADMPAFTMSVVSQACSRMHAYIDREPGTTEAKRSEKHRALGRETQRIVRGLAARGKLSGDPGSLSQTCTRGEVVGGSAAGAGSESGGPPTDTVATDDFVEPTRL